MASSSSQHRCVFVGNIPYDATEEQLIEICREVGPVVSFRLVIDRETGKPKGYGFCEYKDEETALSARRNLQGYEINGRQLRVDFAENDKNADKNREQGRGGPGLGASADPQKQSGGLALPNEASQHQPIGLHVAMTAATVMAGALGGAQTGVQSNPSILPNQSAAPSDPLTFHLAKMSRSQLNQVIAELKMMGTRNKEAAQQLLLTQPQLSKAIFQAQIMLGMVTPQVLQMPNIQQPPGQLAMHLSQEAMHPPIQTIPALPPLAQKIPLGLTPQIQIAQPSALQPKSFVHNQAAASAQPPIRIQSLIPQNPSNMLQQATLGSQSAVAPLPPVKNPSIRPVTQMTSSAFFNQQAQPPFPQFMRPAATANFAHTYQMVHPPISMQSSLPVRPVAADTAFQPGPLITPGNLDAVTKNADSLASVPVDPTRAPKRNVPLNAHPVVARDSSEILGRPSKLAKLDDEKSASNGRLSATASSSQPFTVVSSTNHLPKLEEPRYQDKQGSQLPPDMESTLLQQVLNLTPEQLSSLPPDQRQQVVQLQQALRQDQMQLS